MPTTARSLPIKRAINRLVEPHRIRDRKRSKPTLARGEIPGTLGSAERVSRQNPT